MTEQLALAGVAFLPLLSCGSPMGDDGEGQADAGRRRAGRRRTIVLEHRELGQPPVAHVTTKDEREQLERERLYRIRDLGHEDEGGLRLLVSHFATRPQADRWRS